MCEDHQGPRSPEVALIHRGPAPLCLSHSFPNGLRTLSWLPLAQTRGHRLAGSLGALLRGPDSSLPECF